MTTKPKSKEMMPPQMIKEQVWKIVMIKALVEDIKNKRIDESVLIDLAITETIKSTRTSFRELVRGIKKIIDKMDRIDWGDGEPYQEGMVMYEFLEENHKKLLSILASLDGEDKPK